VGAAVADADALASSVAAAEALVSGGVSAEDGGAGSSTRCGGGACASHPRSAKIADKTRLFRRCDEELRGSDIGCEGR
jgi:hypothetical protein